MESLSAQSDNIPENKDLSCLATNDSESKEKLLEGILAPSKVRLIIGAKSKYSDEEEIDAMEKTDAKRRKSSEKRVRFNEVVDVFRERSSLFSALDDGSGEFAATTVPLRSSIITSQVRSESNNAGDCINVEDFQERYNYLNKGTSGWRLRPRKRFHKKSFGDFIGSQDFTAPLATMEEMEYFSDESPDSVFKDFGEYGEQFSPVQKEESALLTQEGGCVLEASVMCEDHRVKDPLTKGNDLEFLSYEDLQHDTNSNHPLLLKQHFINNIGSTVVQEMKDITVPTESDGFTEKRNNYGVDEGGCWVSIEGRTTSPPPQSWMSLAADTVPLDSASTDDATDDANAFKEESRDTRDGRTMTRDDAFMEDQSKVDVNNERRLAAAEILYTESAEADDLLVRTQDEECLAINEIPRIDEYRKSGDISTAQSKVPGSHDILTLLEPKVPEDILLVPESKVAAEILTDGSTVPEPDDSNRCSVLHTSVITDKMTDERTEVNVPYAEEADVEVPDAGVSLVPGGPFMKDVKVEVGDVSHLIIREGVTEGIGQSEDEVQLTGGASRKDDHVTTSASTADDVIRNEDDYSGQTPRDSKGLTGGEVRIGSAVELPPKRSPAVCEAANTDADGWISLEGNSPGGSSSTLMSSLHSSIKRNNVDGGQLVVSSGSTGDDDESSSQLCIAEAPIQTSPSEFHLHSNGSGGSADRSDSSLTSIRSSVNRRDSVDRCFTCVLIPNLIWLFHRCDDVSSSSSEMGREPVQSKISPGVRRCSAPRVASAPLGASRVVTKDAGGAVRKARLRSGCN